MGCFFYLFMKSIETLQSSLLQRDVQEFEKAFGELLDESAKGQSFQIGFPCMIFAMDMIDEITLEKFRMMCQWCNCADRKSCAAYAALHGHIEPLRLVLATLSREEKGHLRPLFSILIDEGKYEVVYMLLDSHVYPDPDDFTLWPLLASLDTLDVFHRIIEYNALENVLDVKYFDSLKSYCRNLLSDTFLSNEKKQNVRNFLHEFESHSVL
uniref:Nuclear pore complex protein Nup85 n=1 Tax=Paramoeba aestuarina TaxID=180227 RepID=A0A7S4KQQ2_9EUKA